MIVWLIEDDNDQATAIAEAILEAIPGAAVREVHNESEFRVKFGEIASAGDIVIMDVILRWTDASPTMTLRPEDVKSGGADRAGFRCLAMLRNDPRTEAIPVILYSVLDVSALPADLVELARQNTYLTKSDDRHTLIHAIRESVMKC